MISPLHAHPTIPGFFTHWDSTMIGELKTCPRKFYFEHVLGYHARGLNVHLAFGLWFHGGMERYDHSIAEGLPHDLATLRMVRWVLEESGTRTDDEGDGCLGEWHPWSPTTFNEKGIEIPEPYKNRYTLVRSLVWAVEEHRDSPLRTYILANGKPAVELSFRFNAFDIANEPITLCGHMDKVVEDPAGDKWVYDYKSTKSQLNAAYVRQFTPHNQFTLYTIAGKVQFGIPARGVLANGVQIGVGFNRYSTFQVPRPAAVLEEWLADTQWWIAQARSFALADHFPANDKSCTAYGGCPFQRVCAVSPSHRRAWLEDEDRYTKWTWDPLVVRGDV